MAGWKYSSDTGLSALPAAISVRCHCYGDGRMFSLIIGNCEPLECPEHRYTYSYFNDTCQRSRLLQTWWAQQLLQRKCGGLCSVMLTHTHTHRDLYRWVESSVQSTDWKSNSSWKRPKGKEFWQGICLAVSAWQNKSLRTLGGTPGKLEREEQISDIVQGGMFWGLHLMLSLPSDGISPWGDPGRCAAGREGGSVTSHCCKLDNMQLFTTENRPESQVLSHVCSLVVFFHNERHHPPLPMHVTSQSCFVLCWDKYDSWRTWFTRFHVNYAVIIKV